MFPENKAGLFCMLKYLFTMETDRYASGLDAINCIMDVHPGKLVREYTIKEPRGVGNNGSEDGYL